jgi:hypothetical protein
MKTDEIAQLVSIIEQCKAQDVRKILVDYLASELSNKGINPVVKALTINDLKPTSNPTLFNKCAVCCLDGMPGYVCTRGDCPSKITYGINYQQKVRTSGIDTY